MIFVSSAKQSTDVISAHEDMYDVMHTLPREDQSHLGLTTTSLCLLFKEADKADCHGVEREEGQGGGEGQKWHERHVERKGGMTHSARTPSDIQDIRWKQLCELTLYPRGVWRGGQMGTEHWERGGEVLTSPGRHVKHGGGAAPGLRTRERWRAAAVAAVSSSAHCPPSAPGPLPDPGHPSRSP